MAGLGGVSFEGSGHADMFAQTNASGGLSVRFGGEYGGSIIFSRTGQKYAVAQAKDEQCRNAIVSPDGKVALLLMYKVERFGYNYDYIMGLDFTDAALTNVVTHHVLTEKQLSTLLGPGDFWVRDLYKFSPSGDRALISVGSIANSERIYWYNLESNILENP